MRAIWSITPLISRSVRSLKPNPAVGTTGVGVTAGAMWTDPLVAQLVPVLVVAVMSADTSVMRVIPLVSVLVVTSLTAHGSIDDSATTTTGDESEGKSLLTGELGRAFSRFRCMVRARPTEEEGGIGAGEPSVSIHHI